ncbi:MAG: hypothetical protein JJE16_09525 [Nitrospiraceae bacterium]|nr:hypothetical protein [Nitrospiraceae bacterium]
MNPHEFQLIEGRGWLPKVLHISSGFDFVFGGDSIFCSPGAEQITQEVSQLNWLGKSEMLRKWLTYLKREIEVPDLWAALSQEQELLSIEPAEAVNTPFTADEQVQIKKTIEEIRVYITSTYSLASEPLAKVNRKLDYLIDASTRVGRIDWKNIFVGALVGLVLQQLIPSDSGFQQLIGIAGHLLRHVLGGVIPPPLLH